MYKIHHKQDLLKVPFCHIEKQHVEFPNGQSADWYIHHSPDAAVIVPMTPDGQILLQKNYKHGAGQIITEFPAGMIDPGESAEQGAARELHEETGYKGQKLLSLGSAFANPTSSHMKIHFFLALDCQKVSQQQLESAESIEPFLVPDFKTAQSLLTSPRTQTSTGCLTALALVMSHFSLAKN